MGLLGKKTWQRATSAEHAKTAQSACGASILFPINIRGYFKSVGANNSTKKQSKTAVKTVRRVRPTAAVAKKGRTQTKIPLGKSRLFAPLCLPQPQSVGLTRLTVFTEGFQCFLGVLFAPTDLK